MKKHACIKLSTCLILLVLLLGMLSSLSNPSFVNAASKEEVTYLSTKDDFTKALSHQTKTIYVDNIDFVTNTELNINYSVEIIGKSDLSTISHTFLSIIGTNIEEDRINVSFKNIKFDGCFDKSSIDLDQEKTFEEIFGSDREDNICINGSQGYYDLRVMLLVGFFYIIKLCLCF